MNTRRPTSSVALIPKVEGRVSSAEKKRGCPQRPGVPRAGMTLIELGIVMGIVSVLLALVLGLGRHVNAVVKIRRAQAELGEWHDALNRWHLRFGEYPHARIDTETGNVDPFDGDVDWTLKDPARYPLAVLTNGHAIATGEGCYVRYVTAEHPGGTNITFRSFLTSAVSTVDPWGTPYIYLPSDNAKSYTLFSCGPDRKSDNIPTGAASTPDTTLDDIYFER